MLARSVWLVLVLVVPSLATGDDDFFKDFIRTIGSLDPSVSAVTYINGTVLAKQPGTPLQLIFLYEGYNINRKLAQPDGTYLSLSREFLVYRNPITAEILRVWMNPWTSKPNEVFWVANDPVDFTLTPDSASSNYTNGLDTIGWNNDFILEYPNPLTPTNYSKYSAGPFYDAAETMTFFGNLTDLRRSTAPSAPMTATWVRKSEYLPWMEMGPSPGELYCTALSWKCNQGLSCVAEDIMQLVKKYHPEYQTAPTTEEEPNETSWTVFKKTIDQRRQAGQPDIIIPSVNVNPNVSTKANTLDDRVLHLLSNVEFLRMEGKGRAFSEIPGKQSCHLFDYSTSIGVDFEPLPTRSGYRIQLDGYVEFRDANGTILRFWKNPVTGKDCLVKNPMEVAVDLVFKNENFFTMDIPESQSVGLIGAQSTDDGPSRNAGSYSVNFLELIFSYEQLARAETNPNSAFFYGTVATFSTWLSWMEMDDIPGNLVTKTIVHKLPLW